MAENINIGGRLHSTATGNIVAGADEILDDTLDKKQSEINNDVNTALITHESIIQGLNSQNYESYSANEGTTSIDMILPNLGVVNTIYRLGNWDGNRYDPTQYAEYAWRNTGVDQGEYVLLNIKNYGIDSEPTAGSDNLVKSEGIIKNLADNYGYVANPNDWEYVGNCSVSANGSWDVADTYESKSFSVTNLRGIILTVKANNIGNAIISFVKSINYPDNPVFATGETGRHVIPISTPQELTVPLDAVYAVVTTKNDNLDRTPTIFNVNYRVTELDNVTKNISLTTGGKLPNATISFSKIITSNGRLADANVHNYARLLDASHLIGQTITVIPNEINNSIISFLNSDDINAEYARFCISESGRRIVNIGESESFVVPDDCKYLYVVVWNNDNDATPSLIVSATQDSLIEENYYLKLRNSDNIIHQLDWFNIAIDNTLGHIGNTIMSSRLYSYCKLQSGSRLMYDTSGYYQVSFTIWNGVTLPIPESTGWLFGKGEILITSDSIVILAIRDLRNYTIDESILTDENISIRVGTAEREWIDSVRQPELKLLVASVNDSDLTPNFRFNNRVSNVAIPLKRDIGSGFRYKVDEGYGIALIDYNDDKSIISRTGWLSNNEGVYEVKNGNLIFSFKRTNDAAITVGEIEQHKSITFFSKNEMDFVDNEPIIGSKHLITSDGVAKLIDDTVNEENKTWSSNKLFNANQMLNMLSTACANEIGNYREYDNKSFNTVGNVVDNSDFKIVAFCSLKQDTTISIVNPDRRTIRVFILNVFTGLTAISPSEATSQTIPLDSYNSDYTNNIVLVSLPKTATMSVDGIAPTANIALNNIADTIYRTTLRTVVGKVMNSATGEIIEHAEFTLNYFSTESDTFTVSFSSVQSGRSIRIFALKNGVFLGQIHVEDQPTTAIDIDINFPHYGTLFVVQCHKNNVFTISNRVAEDGLLESVRKLSVNSKNQTYLIDTYLNKGRVVYSAHRGLRTIAPENSIPAYEEAGKAGFDFLNLAQLRQSADGTWYVMHDPTIDRTTDGTGAIKDLTDAYLETVHIDAGPNVEQYTPEELVIPTLEKAIQIARKYGMKLYFRIASITGNSYQADKSAWDSFIAIIKKYRCEGMLFGGNALTDLLPLHRELGLDWCINYDVYSSEAVYQQITDYVNAGIKNATIFTTSEILTDAHITAAREKGFKVMVHLTNDNATKAQCLEWSNKGVDIIGGVVKYDLGLD